MEGRVAVFALVVCVGCEVDSPDETTFGVPSMTAAMTTPAGDDDDDADTEGDTEGMGTSDDDDDDAVATDDGTTGSGAGSSGGPVTTMTTMPPPGDSSDGGAVDGGEQPAMGMYSDCLLPRDCVAPSNVCLVVNMDDGFCTNMGCVNPAADCDPTPGGTATPICFPVELDMMAQNSCALDCSSGQTCPAGMMCYALADGSICA